MSLENIPPKDPSNPTDRNFDKLGRSVQQKAHQIMSSVPLNSYGVNGQVVIVNGTPPYSYCKINNVWKKLGT